MQLQVAALNRGHQAITRISVIMKCLVVFMDSGAASEDSGAASEDSGQCVVTVIMEWAEEIFPISCTVAEIIIEAGRITRAHADMKDTKVQVTPVPDITAHAPISVLILVTIMVPIMEAIMVPIMEGIMEGPTDIAISENITKKLASAVLHLHRSQHVVVIQQTKHQPRNHNINVTIIEEPTSLRTSLTSYHRPS